MNKILKILVILFFFNLIFAVLRQWPDEYVHVIFCDVGEGDAILLTYDDTQILVDGGKDESVLRCLEENMPFWDKNIDLLVATHMDMDHIGGLLEVLPRYSVNVILSNPSLKKTAVFTAFETALSREKDINGFSTPIISSFLGQQFLFDDVVKFSVISPQVIPKRISVDNLTNPEGVLSDKNGVFERKIGKDESENNLSIGLLVDINEISILLTGDMEKEAELAVINNGMTKPIDILKVGHHGSKSSSSKQFLSILRPEVSVISSGVNNQYNHPSPRVLSTLSELGSKIYRTDRQGTIEFITDGYKYWKAVQSKRRMIF